jgi:hypothetical protein
MGKSKMICFRVSDEEYEALQSLCLSYGTKNISELARHAVNRMTSDTRLGVLETRLEALSRRFDLLDRRMLNIAEQRGKD